MEKSPSPTSNKKMSLKRKASIEVPIVNNKAEDKSEVLNGKPNKKIIKLSEVMTNIDPLEYFSRFLDIPQMIFRHFKGKDLIAASEVSPSYYNFIASSKLLMKDIKVVFDDKLKTIFKHLKAEDLITISPHQNGYNIITSSKFLMKFNKIHSEDHSLLKNSSRFYQNIEIKRTSVKMEDENLRKFDDDYVTNSELEFFNSRAHEWKNVSLRNVYFRNQLDLWRFLSAIEPSVESISVTDFGGIWRLPFEDSSSVIKSFKALMFPKLKKVLMFHKCVNSFSDTLASFLLNSVAIEELDLRDVSGKISKDVLTKMLGNFDKLTNLHLSSAILDELFEDESWKQFKFKLKSLTVGVFIETEIYTNFHNFLKSQSDYLENLMFPALDIERETFDVIMTMRKLNNLTLIYCNKNEVPKKVSTSITELTLINSNTAVTLKFLLDSMPKISRLTLDSIDEENFILLKSLKRKFEKLRVGELIGVDRKEIEEIMTDNYISLEIQ